MGGESLLFIEPAPGKPATASLLMTPRGAVSLQSATGEVEYVEHVDYTLDRVSGLLTRTPGSRLPATTIAELHPSIDQEGSGFMHVRGDPTRFLMVSEGDTFHRRQATASYSFDRVQWTGYAPHVADATLRSTLERLHRGDALTVCLVGDSISEGYNASGFIGVPPYQPAYGELVASGLEQVYESQVTLRNLASAGWTSDDGRCVVDAVTAAEPHLVVVAFGMNDAGYAEPAEYAVNIRSIVEETRRGVPGVEFILVSSMLPNPEWHYPQPQRFAGYRRALADLCGPGVALADLTTLWTDLLVRKSLYDLTGNGINHPNDFGHRLYAQTILSLLTE